jgi:hypothetical protein
MSAESERLRRFGTEAYWAVEIQLSDGGGQGRRYLCHAGDERAASDQAKRLMGSGMAVRGFNAFWIDAPQLANDDAALPGLGAYRSVPDPREWTHLMDAHKVSQAGFSPGGQP